MHGGGDGACCGNKVSSTSAMIAKSMQGVMHRIHSTYTCTCTPTHMAAAAKGSERVESVPASNDDAAPLAGLGLPASLEQVFPGIAIVPDFAQNVLGVAPAELQESLERGYPVRQEGDEIAWGGVQWVAGDNAALKYRGNVLKRGKIWLQRGKLSDVGFRRYFYTGWQWKVLPATADVADCAEMSPVADAYDAWCDTHGLPRANHYIVTRYEDGQHNIGFHYDKPKDIAAGSLITVVKTGAHARPFELRRLATEGEDQGKILPFFSRELAPGTAVVMTLEANLATQHGVPVVADRPLGPSGSIVFRTITTTISEQEVRKKLGMAISAPDSGASGLARDFQSQKRDAIAARQSAGAKKARK